MSYKIHVLYGWPPALPRAVLLVLPCACAPRAALALPGAPLAPSGRLARSGALAPCAGGPPGVFRRLRAAGARSAPAPSARRLRTLTLAALAIGP